MSLAMFDIRPEVANALKQGRAVVALESSLVAHGLPWPMNLETAQAAEAAIRDEEAVPATIAIWQGRPTIGLDNDQLAALAQAPDVLKASRRDIAMAIAQGRTAATTVAATMSLAQKAGIDIFATGGIGGVHRGDNPWDISADLLELSRTRVAVVCAGPKSILDSGRTLEILETHGVPVLGYGTDELPAFYMRTSGVALKARVDTIQQAATILAIHWQLGGAGVVLAQPVAASLAMNPEEFNEALVQAENQAVEEKVRGSDLTPYLLTKLAESTQGRTLEINQALVIANAQLAARVACALVNRHV